MWELPCVLIKTGQPLYYISSINDITERVQAENALRISEERFRAWVENSSDLVSVIGMDGKIQYESPSVERLLGYKPKELIGRNAFDLVHPDDRERVTEIFNQNVQKPESLTSTELRFRHHNGSWRVLEVLGKPYLDENGQMVALVNSRDITERKRIEEELREGENRVPTNYLFENSGTANTISINIIASAANHLCQPSYLKMFRLSGLVNRRLALLSLFTPECQAISREKIWRRAKGLPNPAFYEAECQRKDGTKFPGIVVPVKP